MVAEVVSAPSAKALERMAEARDYHYSAVEPVIEKAIQYLRMQKPKPERMLPSLLASRPASGATRGAAGEGLSLPSRARASTRAPRRRFRFLKNKLEEGGDLPPDRSRAKLPPVPASAFPTAFLAPILAEIVKEMPPKEDVLKVLVSKLSKAMGVAEDDD
mmetsp:Transcript_5594/g.16474  ORF Transcript_5594/g.16474 Transcript_5594/m.16474 type:complete len:160 (-) Transcript_5594:192-671(-)